MDKDEAEKKIRQAAEEGKIKFCESDGVDSFDRSFVNEFMLSILGLREFWISDKSSLTDFGGHAQDAGKKIEEKYGIAIEDKTMLIDIFRLIHQQNRTPQ
jgi:hypothetical protein